MQVPLELSFRNMAPSDAVETAVRDKVEWLEKFCPNITGCHVVIEKPHRHHEKGNLFNVKIRISVPGEQIVVSHEPQDDHAHEDMYVEIRDVFNAARRRLEDYVRRRRHKVKTHLDNWEIGRVVRVDSELACGFIVCPDGREVYFHQNSLHNADYDQLEIGNTVKMLIEEGEKGLQASAVQLAGSAH